MEETIRGLAQVIWWLPPLIVAVPFAWIMFRSGSTFALRHRFWRLTRPEQSIEDDDIRKAVTERADLIAFRALLMRADNLGEAKRLISWAKANDVDVGTLGESERYFDRRTMAFKEPIPTAATASALSPLIYYFLSLVALVAIFLVFQSSVLLKFKDDSTWFLLSKTNAQLLHTPGSLTMLASGDCPKPAGWAGFDAKHTAAICSAFKGAGLNQQIDQALLTQRISALSILAMALFCFSGWSRRIIAIRGATSIVHQLVQRQNTSSAHAGPTVK